MMKRKIMKYLTSLVVLGVLLVGCSSESSSKSAKTVVDPVASQTKLNKKTASAISSLDDAITDKHEQVSNAHFRIKLATVSKFFGQ